jgi:hypothetical protein
MTKPKYLIKGNKKNWWVTYRDGALAHPRALDTREEARKVRQGLIDADTLLTAVRAAPYEEQQKAG